MPVKETRQLTADTIAMAVTTSGSSMPDGYGYFRSGGFSGCVVGSSQPDDALVLDVYSTLFNCESEHALTVFENHHYGTHPGWFIGWDFDTEAVLLTCYGIDCITPNRGCVNLTENDPRLDAAANRLHERRCVDGVLSGWREVPGWESDCEFFIPDDVECTVYGIYASTRSPRRSQRSFRWRRCC